ncbi:MAG: LapA family protein [Gammaproteobacteria bacterium]|nr:LapA family protein [Gammaproteobacteria bacterium]MBT5407108.1 LapA family protein [Gammaproteobacteria bacterium]MBT5863600.1 LapA family protein [Gammaproteobacteria bacterium]MBT6734015.1 LapA family protein [Gammaproteobacteria bacterium]
MFRVLIFLVTLFLLALSITISMLNTSVIEIDLYLHKYSAPIPLFLFISFLIGSFLALLFFLSSYIRHKHEARGLRKILKVKEDEIDSLRKNPLRDDHE